MPRCRGAEQGVAVRSRLADCRRRIPRYSARLFAREPIMTEIRYDVLAIGNAIVDVIARADDNFLVRHDMRKGAMSLIVEEQAEHIYETMGPAVEISGGSAANTIVGVANFGARAAFVGKVRDDA